MSNRIVKTLLSDGPTKAIFSFYLESDGAEGELNNYTLIDPVQDFAVVPDKLTILQIWYGFSWFDALLTFDDVVAYPSWELTRDSHGYFDFRYFKGLADRSGIDRTGKLFITTNGFAPSGSLGTLIVEIIKE